MDRNLRIDSSCSNKQTVLIFYILCLASSVFLGFTFTFSVCFCWSNICLQNDKGIQTTYRSLRSDNKKNIDSWFKFDLLPSWNKFWTNFFNNHRFRSDSLWIFRFNKKATWTYKASAEINWEYCGIWSNRT